jgi:hypothetical protein
MDGFFLLAFKVLYLLSLWSFHFPLCKIEGKSTQQPPKGMQCFFFYSWNWVPFFFPIPLYIFRINRVFINKQGVCHTMALPFTLNSI